MHPLLVVEPGRALKVLCIGAHSDDIEIGVGGTLLDWIAVGGQLDVTWCVLSAKGQRAEEAERGADSFLAGAFSSQVELAEFRDSHFPYQGSQIKGWFERLARRISPDVIFTHRRDDAHPDHREVSKLTWNAFRNHLVLEYEIPKWDGDFGQPNAYVPLSGKTLMRKIQLLKSCFGTKRPNDWFDAETFRGLARLRGMECRAPERYAEAFFARKINVELATTVRPPPNILPEPQRKRKTRRRAV